MHRYLFPWIIMLICVTPSVVCEEVGYVFGESGGHRLLDANISKYDALKSIKFTTAVGPGGTATTYQPSKTVTVGELQNIFDQRVEPKVVHDQATELAMQSPGDHTIEQICYIHSYLTKAWNYTGDPRGIDYYKYANETLRLGKRYNRAGAGDCDDYAILMAALIESIGGTTRVILAYGPNGGHAYAEVYLGKIDSNDKNAERITEWLMQRYNVKEIYAHTNISTGDVWLNLDWGKDKYGASYPGGPFYPATDHMPIYVRDTIDKDPLNPSPRAIFSRPSEANGGEQVTFDASRSGKVDEITDYSWDFGDNSEGNGSTVVHTYSHGGRFPVTLRVMDSQGLESANTSFISINDPPIAFFTYSPLEPHVGDLIEFNASSSKDRDGRIVNYEWKVGNRKFEGPDLYYLVQPFPKSGNSAVSLTLTDDKGAQNTTSKIIKVIEPPPEAIATYSPSEPKVGDVITFDASQSKDKRGRITEYDWDFDDGYSGKRASIKHQYLENGTYNVKLTVTNDKGIQNISMITVVVKQKETSTLTLADLAQGGSSSGTIPSNPIESSSQDAAEWYDKGSVLGTQGKYDEAIQAYDEAIRLNPNYAEAYGDKGRALYYLGRYHEAIQACDNAIRIDPKYAPAWFNKGLALVALNGQSGANSLSSEAAEDFAKAKELGLLNTAPYPYGA